MESLPDAAVGFLLSNLKDFVTRQTRLNHDMEGNIHRFVQKLDFYQALLRDLDGRKFKGEVIRDWVREIKTLSYAIEDAVEYHISNVESRKGAGIIRSVRQQLASLVDYRSTILQVESQIDSVSRRLQYLFSNLRSEGSTKEFKDSMLNVSEFEGNLWPLKQINIPISEDDPEDDFVGMEKDIEALVCLLLNEGANYPVISLFGKRGWGKTALAKQLFKHPRVKEHFKGFAWIQLSQTFQTGTVLHKILKQLSSEEAVQKDDARFAQKLHQVLQEKNYLVVLDDIRSKDAWDSLSNAFPFKEMTSKIMLTTRITEVVEAVSKTVGLGYIHTMKSLFEEDGWILFQKRAYPEAGPDFQVPGMRKVIGKGLVRWCRGIPLAVSMLGALMASKKTLKEWELVYQEIESQGNVRENALTQVLAPRFIGLPQQLKSCLLYLGYFPEESVIEVEQLYLLWMAEVIRAPPGPASEGSMVDIAEKYLESLNRCGLVKVEEEMTNLRRYKSCSIDGLVRELCLAIAKEEEFAEVIDLGRGVTDSSSFDSTNPLRRLVIYLDKNRNRRSVPLLRENAKYLRFLLVYNAHENQGSVLLPEETYDLSSFTVLRTLDFDGVDFGNQKRLLSGLSRLGLLKYLSFKGCYLKALPKAVGKLLFLQILDLRVRSEIFIPDVLWKMKRLTYLYLPEKFRTPEDGKLRFDSLIELVTLKNFCTRMCDVKHLLYMANLRFLAASVEVTIEAGIDDLKGLIDRISKENMLSSSIDVKNFDCYTEERHSVFRQLLECAALHTFSMEGQIRQIPSFNRISKRLTKIVLSGSGLKEDPMLAFQELPYLRVLVLTDDAFQGEKMVCSASGFRELKSLELLNLRLLKNWTIEKGALSKLSTLTFESCRSLKTVPEGLEFISNLATLNIRQMPQTFEENIKAWKGKAGHKVSINEN